MLMPFIQEVSASDYFMVSYDIYSCLQIYETIDLVVNIIFGNSQSMNITKPQLKKILVFTTSQTHFLFNNEIYTK